MTGRLLLIDLEICWKTPLEEVLDGGDEIWMMDYRVAQVEGLG